MIQVKGRVVARALLLLAPLVSACGPSKNDVQAMKLELSSMTSLLDTDLEQVKQKGKASLEKARAKNDLDEFLQAVKSAWSDQIAGCETSLSKMDVLEAFMLRNDEYAKELGFGEVRRSVVGKRAQVQVLRSRTEASLSGIRDKTSAVNANGEWQTLGVTVEPDEIAVAKGAGKWTIGDFAGSCDQAGLNSPGLQSYAIDNKFPVGSLLTRVGKSVLGSGEVAAKIPAPGGELEARCNDRDYLNNHGELRVRVVAFKVP